MGESRRKLSASGPITLLGENNSLAELREVLELFALGGEESSDCRLDSGH